MSAIIATFGSVLRDLVCNEIPALFRDHQSYALCAVAGGLIYLIAVAFDISSWGAMTLCALTTTGRRSAVLFFELTLPAIGRH